MTLVSLVNSYVGPMLGIGLARILPAEMAYALASRLAMRAASKEHSALVRALRSNQGVVRGMAPTDPRLVGAVQEVLQSAAHGYVTLFRAMANGRESLLEAGVLDDHLAGLFKEYMERKSGLIIVGAHMGSFDIMLLSLSSRGLPVQALSYSDPRGSYLYQNSVRRKYGLDMTPISLPSLRQAMRHLRSGGIVLTGVDMPVDGSKELHFFGRPARLPIGHARLAVSAGVPLVVVVTPSLDGHGYTAIGEGPIWPEHTGDERRDSVELAQRVLNVLEGYVRRWPGQWLMYKPLWPELLQA